MIKLILNDTFESELTGFSRNTNFDLTNNIITSTAYCYVRNLNSGVYDLGEEPVTSLEIKKDNETIYDTGTITAHIISIDENLNGDEMSANLTLRIDM